MSTGTATQRARGGRALLESQIQKQCVDFLTYDGWRPLKTDPCKNTAWGKGFGELGMADHLFLRSGDESSVIQRYPFGLRTVFPRHHIPKAAVGEIMWIEFKRRGKKAEPRQLVWHMNERVFGFLTAIAGIDFPPTFEGFTEWYRTSGLIRRLGL